MVKISVFTLFLVMSFSLGREETEQDLNGYNVRNKIVGVQKIAKEFCFERKIRRCYAVD